jgi:hypothetical protein
MNFSIAPQTSRLGLRASDFTVVALSLAVLATLPAHANGPNLITNPGFETSTLSGWNPNNNSSFQGVTSTVTHSGNYAYFDGPYPSYGDLSQSILTTPGTSYDISFWLKSGGSPSNAIVSFEGVQILNLVDQPVGPFQQYTFVDQATSTSATLDFQFRNHPDFWYLDDVSVTAAAAPEASTTLSFRLLLVLGLGGVVVAARRRKA